MEYWSIDFFFFFFLGLATSFPYETSLQPHVCMNVKMFHQFELQCACMWIWVVNACSPSSYVSTIFHSVCVMDMKHSGDCSERRSDGFWKCSSWMSRNHWSPSHPANKISISMTFSVVWHPRSELVNSNLCGCTVPVLGWCMALRLSLTSFRTYF